MLHPFNPSDTSSGSRHAGPVRPEPAWRRQPKEVPVNTIRTISDVLRDKADETKKGITFVENRRDVFVPYGRVHAEAVAAATRLTEAGIGPGDRVIFQVSENRGLIRAFWGSHRGVHRTPVPGAGNGRQGSGPVVRACIDSGTGYIDVNDSIDARRAIVALDGDARREVCPSIRGYSYHVAFDALPDESVEKIRTSRLYAMPFVSGLLARLGAAVTSRKARAKGTPQPAELVVALSSADAGDAGIHIEVPHDNPTTGPLPTAAHCDTKEKGKR